MAAAIAPPITPTADSAFGGTAGWLAKVFAAGFFLTTAFRRTLRVLWLRLWEAAPLPSGLWLRLWEAAPLPSGLWLRLWEAAPLPSGLSEGAFSLCLAALAIAPPITPTADSAFGGTAGWLAFFVLLFILAISYFSSNE